MTQNHVRLNQFAPHVVSCADEMLARLTLAEKVGQTFVYSDLEIESPAIGLQDTLVVSARVTNLCA